MSSQGINPAVVVQSTVALAIAITCTDAIRDIIVAVKPASPSKTAVLRIFATIILIILTMIIIKYFAMIESMPAGTSTPAPMHI